MKRTLLAIFLASLQITGLLALGVSANEEYTDVIVELDCPEGEDPYEYALSCAKYAEWAIDGCDYGYIYDTVLCGFHAELPEDEISAIEKLDFVKAVYETAEYEPLAYTDSETAMLPAAMVGFNAANRYGLTGEGITVAVIDNGFDITHPAFGGEIQDALAADVYIKQLNGLRLNANAKLEDSSQLYHSSKIPFVYDYFGGDTNVFNTSSHHGTHVAGIIGAVAAEGTSMHGYAPNCQLLFMKIFDDESKTAGDQVLIAALEDAIKLGADVVNLSIGHYAGSVNADRIMGLNNVLAKAEEAGIIVVCASGNDAVVTEDSSLAKENGIIYPLASYTDYGTISAPASSDHTIAVAGVNNAVYYGTFLRHADDLKLYVPYTDTNEAGGVTELDFSKHFDKQTLEYVPVPGIGEDKDYEGIDVTGKIALIERGTITFVDKVNIAAAHGAVGAIIYNNVKNEQINMELTGALIPAVAITLDDGKLLLEKDTHRLLFDSNIIAIDHPENAAKIASFTSYGTTPSLTLKPDIAGVGGSVYSAINGGGYGGVSGTSMASPQISGICALLMEHARLEGITDNVEAAKRIRTALLNSAIPVLQSDGTAYSPRAQGAGLVNLAAAIEHETELVYTKNGKSKIELGDGLETSFSFDITVNNLTDKAVKAKIGMTLTSDGYTELAYNGKENYYSNLTAVADTFSVISIGESGNINRHSEDYTPYIIGLEAGENRTLTVTVMLDERYYEELSEIFTNGLYLEGYIYCDTENSSVSIPYLGYKGDFGKASVLDGSIYEDETIIFKGTRFFVPIEEAFVSAGGNLFKEDAGYDIGIVSFSPNGNGFADKLYFGTSFLRNSKQSRMTVTDGNGNEVYSLDMKYIQKTSGVDETTVFRYIWDGGDGVYNGYVMPDGEYVITFLFVLDDGKDTNQTYSYKITLDNTDPTAKSISLDGSSLTIDAEDANGIFAVRIYESDKAGAYSKTITQSSASFDISDYSGSRLYYEIVDYAYNTTVGVIELDGLMG